MSAPIDGNPIDINKPPKWINPCPSGQVPSQGFDEFILTDQNSDLPTNREILDRIVLMARNAIHEIDLWREAYTQHAFQKDFQSNVDMLKNLFNLSTMQWLPSDKITGKQLGQPLSDEVKKSLDRNAVLQTTYQWLQSAAVGLEQITADQYKNNEPFKKKFSDAFLALNLILCEIHAALTEFNVNKLSDIGRDVMSDVDRKPLNETERNLRDWFILVKYLNILEYTESAFKYLSEHS